MTDVQVSNARRIGFTALALVAFWVLALKAYWMSCDYVYETLSSAFFTSGFGDWSMLWAPGFASLMALAPMLFLSLSVSNKPLHVGSRWILSTGVLFFATVYIVLWLGRIEAEACMENFFNETGNAVDGFTVRRRFFGGLSSLPQCQTVSWLWLLLPIILTTAFVIYGAWRRAVRDAEVDAMGEGE